jgi:hypothetical protein
MLSMWGLRLVLALAAPLLGMAAWSSSASAAFHLMKVREVYPSSSIAADDGYVELQMLAPGQNAVAGHDVTTYDSTGGLIRTAIMGTSVAQGANQATILIGEENAAGSPDFVDDALDIPRSGGAVCFSDATPPDCVAWGAFSGSLPATTGDPASPSGVSPGKALHRSIAAGCATLLEDADDSDSSATDFSEQDPNPRNNAAPIVEQLCPNTVIGEPRPANPTNLASATFNFSSPGNPGATFQCRLDTEAEFTACASPHTYPGPLPEGTRTFQVKAIVGGAEDPTPASYTWTIDLNPPPNTVITRAPKRKGTDRTPTVRFRSDPVGASGFECRIDAKPYAACTSPHTTKKLKLGKHIIRVRAIGPEGVDPTPARARFKIVKRR